MASVRLHPEKLPAFRAGVYLFDMSRDEYEPLLSSGEARAASNRKRLLSIVLPLDDQADKREFKGRVPVGQRLSFKETVGVYKVWRHAPAAKAWAEAA